MNSRQGLHDEVWEHIPPGAARAHVVTSRGARGERIDIILRLRRDAVEVWAGTHCRAVFDRDELRAWLSAPRDWLEADDVLWVGSDSHVAIGVRGVQPLGDVRDELLDFLKRAV